MQRIGTFQNLNIQPGDIFFAISLAELILSIHWFSTAMYAAINEASPSETGTFCMVNSIFAILAGGSEVLYTCVFFAWLGLKFSFKNQVNKKRIIILPAIFALGATIYSISTGKNGLSLFGTCSFKKTTWYQAPLFITAYSIVSCFFFNYIRKTMKQTG